VQRWIRGTAGLVLFSILAVILSSSEPAATSMSGLPDPRGEDWPDRMLAHMTLEEKVGQMLMVGFHNGDAPAYEMNRQALRLVHKYHVGGIILFDRNIESPRQVTQLTRQLQGHALGSSPGIPLLISVDQEGGKVSRFDEGVTLFPGNMALGATRDPALAYQAGKMTGAELRSMGIHMNLAPVMDVNNNAANPVIGVRSFSGDPEWTAVMGLAQIRGYHEGQVLTAVKHFPGHGDTDMDSHLDLPTVNHSMKRLHEVELVPFRQAIQQGVDAVMSAHITFPAIEGKGGIPGTLSHRVLTGLLREQMGYQGVIITDDMEMGAIAEHFGSAKAAVRAVQAGADLILISHDEAVQQKAMAALVHAVQQGTIPEKRIDQSVRRILQLKQQRLGAHSIVREPTSEPLPAGKNRSPIADEIAERAVTLVQNPQNILPLQSEKHRRLLVIAPVRGELLAQAFRGAGFQAASREMSLDPDPKEVHSLIEAGKKADAVIVAVSQSQLHKGQQKAVRGIYSTRKPVVVLGLDTPYDVLGLPKEVPYLALYSAHPASLREAARIVAGEAEAAGRLPVEIPGRYPIGYGLSLKK
jgi:beta-N-acetylhexosaminidase